MKKQIQQIFLLIFGISFILVPLLTVLTVVSFMEKKLLASLGYGLGAVTWIYSCYQWLKIVKELKNFDANSLKEGQIGEENDRN